MRPDGLLYQNGDWAIYTGSSVGLNQFYSDVVHDCSKYKTDVDEFYHKGMVSYQIMGMTKCPGCGEIQPEDIQTLWALHNMDKPTPSRIWGNGPLTATKSSLMALNRPKTEMIKK